jgi:penicillin-binding protein 2
MQLAQAMATLANDGVVIRPHLVKYVENSKSGERTYVAAEPVKRIALKREHIDFIKKAMVGVNKEGTGARAFAGAGYVSAGKTGTAQVFSLKGEKYLEGRIKERLRDHALFIAFAPADAPKIALAVLVENGGFGAQSAAPIVRQVLDYYLLDKVPEGVAREDEDAAESE